ncbi:hypothetical protein ACF5W4_11180 [Bacillota bacterium Lsc_1132]
MAKDKKQNTDQQPGNPDPYNMDAKRQLHSKADEMNFIGTRRGKPVLCCGARKKKGPGFCRSLAGSGTDHTGYGRCKYCGGSNTGPKTVEGKAAAAQNSRKHGFYSKVLRGQEQETYENLLEAKAVTLLDEIFMLKAKILTYLDKWQNRIDKEGEKAAHQWVTSGIDQERTYYTASTADDRVLQRALETLRRLIDSHSKLTGSDGEGLLDSINKELRAASQGEVTVAWKARPAQARKTTEN